MDIKRAIRKIIDVTQIPVRTPRDRVINKHVLKHTVESLTGMVRILATDSKHAGKIAYEISKHQDDLGIRSVHIVDKALDYNWRPGEEILFNHSVMVRLDAKQQLEFAVSNWVANELDSLRRSILDCEDEHKPENIVIDFSSPNIAKPFHFGHLKSTILGNYLANLNTFLGNKVTKLNYIGDWGTQYGLLSLGLDEFDSQYDSKKEEYKKSPLKYLLDVYVQANERGKQDENFYTEARRRFMNLDNNCDATQVKKWREIRDLSLDELKRSYEQLGINFDCLEFESDYARESSNLVDQMRSKNLLKRLDDGVLVAEVEKKLKPVEVPVLKSDGTSLYITRDVVAALARKERYDFDRMLYVVGADQEKHFHSLREIVRKLEHCWADQLIHVKMGKVLGMSSRSGNFVLLSDIIKEATNRYMESTRSVPTSKVLEPEDVKRVGKELALSALFVFDMRNKRTRNYQFDWDLVVLASERSGIQLQTSHARLCSLLARSAAEGLIPFERGGKLCADAIGCVEGVNLVSQLNELDTALHNSYWTLDPSPLVNHALHLSKATNRARQSNWLRVLSEPDERMARTRLSLFNSARLQLEFIIKMIGLKPLHRV